MLRIAYTTAFRRDLKKVTKQQKDCDLLGDVIKKLSAQRPLEVKYKDHPLIGNYKGKRECHLAPDWLLIYEINEEEKELALHRTGSHSELFKR